MDEDKIAEAIQELAKAMQDIAEELHEINRRGLLTIVQDKFPVNSDRG